MPRLLELDYEARLDRHARPALRLLDRALEAADHPASAEIRIGIGDPAEVIEAVAVAEHAQLIAVGSRGQGRVRAALLGSVSAGLASSSKWPVLIVSPTPRPSLRRAPSAARYRAARAASRVDYLPWSMVPSSAQLKKLAGLEPGEPVLSVHCRTDPREPRNRAQTPGWLVALRNGLSDLAGSLEAEGTREDRLALRSLGAELETRILHLDGSQRGRSLAWFVTPSGTLDQRFALQLPLRADAVVWDRRPFISPLVEVVDRGRSTGLVLVGSERVRLLHWEQGIVEEPDRSTFDLELGDWRRYQAYAPANPAMAQQTATNQASFDRRVEEWRERFFEAAAEETAGRLQELGWERILVAAEGQVASAFADALPEPIRARLVSALDLNVVDRSPGEVAAEVEPHIDEAWRRSAVAVIETTIDRAKGGGAAALGVEETVAALSESRVEHLILAPQRVIEVDPGPRSLEFLDGAPPHLLAERAVEAAILSGARVTSLGEADSALLAEAAGIAALLRY